MGFDEIKFAAHSTGTGSDEDHADSWSRCVARAWPRFGLRADRHLCGEPQTNYVFRRRRRSWRRQRRLTTPRLACQPSKKKPQGIPGLSRGERLRLKRERPTVVPASPLHTLSSGLALHWVLDTGFDEDNRARNRRDHGPENLATLRSSPSTSSIRRKRKRSGWSDDFARSILGHMR